MHRTMTKLARGMAVLGGIVLCLLILIVCLSVIGRAMNGMLHGPIGTLFPDLAAHLIAVGIGPINGDFELVEAGIAFAIFAFLPLCQITNGHAKVDIFTSTLPIRADRLLKMVTEIVFALVLILIAWRLYEGTISKKGYGETTFLLQFPIWWAYGASLFASCIAAVMGIYMAITRSIEFFLGRSILSASAEVDH